MLTPVTNFVTSGCLVQVGLDPYTQVACIDPGEHPGVHCRLVVEKAASFASLASGEPDTLGNSRHSSGHILEGEHYYSPGFSSSLDIAQNYHFLVPNLVEGMLSYEGAKGLQRAV